MFANRGSSPTMKHLPRPAIVSSAARRLFLVGLVATVAAASWTPAAMAQEGDPAKAKGLYLEARKLNDEGQVRESLVKLREAYEAFPSEVILLSIANRYLDLGEPEEAAVELAKISPKSSKMRKQVKKLTALIEEKLAEPVTIKLAADADGATAGVDGGAFQTLPARLQLPRGLHKFVVRAPGRTDVEFERVLKGSLEYPIIVKMDVSPGRFRIAVDPPERLQLVRILINGQQIPLSREERNKPLTDLREAPPGQYKVSCLMGTDERADALLFVKAGKVAVASCVFDAPVEGEGISMWAWITGGTALAAMGAGAGVLIQHYAELPALKEQYPAPRYKIRSSKPAVGASILAAGGALGIVSALFFAEVF